MEIDENSEKTMSARRKKNLTLKVPMKIPLEKLESCREVLYIEFFKLGALDPRL